MYRLCGEDDRTAKTRGKGGHVGRCKSPICTISYLGACRLIHEGASSFLDLIQEERKKVGCEGGTTGLSNTNGS